MTGCFFVLASFLVALRREETLNISLSETIYHFKEAEGNAKQSHIVLSLRRKFKGENGEGCHFVAVTCLTNSGLRLGPWVKRALSLKEKRGRIKCSFFAPRMGGG